MCLDMISRQWNADFWLSGPNASSMKTVSDCLQRNLYASGILQVILRGGSHKKALMSRLNYNKSVFTLCYDPLMTTAMSMPDISMSLKLFTHPGNSALGHTKDTSHMPLGKPSLRHPDPSIHLFGIKTPSYPKFSHTQSYLWNERYHAQAKFEYNGYEDTYQWHTLFPWVSLLPWISSQVQVKNQYLLDRSGMPLE